MRLRTSRGGQGRNTAPGLKGPLAARVHRLTSVSRYYHHGPYSVVIVTFGVVLSALALFGIAVSWRRRHARSLALLWLACALLSLGSALWVGSHRYIPVGEVVHGVRLSMIMPYTWFVRIPGLATFREG